MVKIPELTVWQDKQVPKLRVFVRRNVTFRKQAYVWFTYLNDGVRSSMPTARLLNEFEEVR